jgi:UDP-2,4-diacetamido-2,4,6-trideoxy-beta-L-altropyranose hydrolase
VSPRTIAFHASGGKSRGLGHVRRSLSLATALRNREIESRCLIDGDRAAIDLVEAAGFRATGISDVAADAAVGRAGANGSTVLVIDSYDVIPDNFDALLRQGWTLVAIDDLADRRLPVHLIVNGTVGATESWYTRTSDAAGSGVPLYLLGPSYVLLGTEFTRGFDRSNRESVERVLVTVGGSDNHNLTPRLIEAAAAELPSAGIDVIVGPFFDNTSAIDEAARAAGGRVKLCTAPARMGELMVAADVAICGGGQTTYELAAVGTPAVGVRCAANQARNLDGFAAAGTLLYAGDASDTVLDSAVRRHLRSLAHNSENRTAMSVAGRRIVDGRGADRVAAAIAALMPAA